MITRFNLIKLLNMAMIWLPTVFTEKVNKQEEFAMNVQKINIRVKNKNIFIIYYNKF